MDHYYFLQSRMNHARPQILMQNCFVNVFKFSNFVLYKVSSLVSLSYLGRITPLKCTFKEYNEILVNF